MKIAPARRFAAGLIAALVVLAVVRAEAADTVLVPSGAVWKYLDDGSNQGSAWRGPAFDDSAWKSGPAQLGYGDADEATVVGFGPDPNNKFITTYFRRGFGVTDPAAFVSLTLRLVRDDGAVVYVNGTEVFRSNMPAGAIGYTTPATVAIGGGDESTYVTTSLAPGVLVAGANVIAVELHQANGTSSDLSFNLELVGSSGATVTRGPYLQAATSTSIVVRWRTNAVTDRRVWYGSAPGSLTSVATAPGTGTDHEVRVSGLGAATTYYYAVGTTAGPLAGGDASHVFVMPPVPGTATPIRMWMIGDAGTASTNQLAVRDAYVTYTGARRTDLWLMLGDNAYSSGTDAQYQGALYDIYPSLLRQTPFYPAYGNHDAESSTAATQSGPYFDMLTLPIQGEAGGVASSTKAYYSFDHGNVHVVVLDSSESDRSPTGPMLTWLKDDLAANTRPWTIAIWHHPPYTKGSHNSDTEAELMQMRQNALPILENGGVDLVLTGHSHSYERSVLLDGHYGASSTITAAMKKDAGSGREDGSGAYRKPTLGPAPREGAVYVVAGSSGQVSGGTLNHPAMFTSLNSLGSLVVDVNGARLDARFIDQTGAVRDYFTMLKGPAPGLPTAPGNLTATAAGSARVDLAWTDRSGNETGFQVERSVAGGSYALAGTAGANATTYADTAVQPATAYSYRVRATGDAGASGWSNTASATTAALTPAAPTGLVATALSRSQIRLTWTDASSNETGFRIERSTNGTSFSQIASVGAGVTSYTSTGLSKNRTYWYRVRAYNAAGNSSYSNTASAQTLR
jgi:hypothetical protein